MAALKKCQAVSFRIDPEDDLIRRATETCVKSATAFMTEAAVSSAQKEMLDHRFVGVDSEVFDSVLSQLDAPLTANAELVRLVKDAPEWID